MPTNWKMFFIIVGGFVAMVMLGGILNYWDPNIDTAATTDLEVDPPPTDEDFDLADYEDPKAVIKTAKGDIKIALHPEAAPLTVENFIRLAKAGYYDGLTFHRVIPGFMIQGGDPAGDGTGGTSIWQTDFQDEINAKSLGLDQILVKDASFLANLYTTDQLAANADKTVEEFYASLGYHYDDTLTSLKMEPGALAMANSGPDTNGSQFFIVTLEDQPHLDGKHTVFGTVIEGLDIAQQIAQGDVIDTIGIRGKVETQAKPATNEDTSPTEIIIE